MVKLEWAKKKWLEPKARERRRTSPGSKQHSGSRGNPLKLSEARRKPNFVNKPLSNFDLLRWIEFLEIPNFKGIVLRDQQMPWEHSPCILNLDSYENTGTHWVCCVPSKETKKTLWYFHSLGLPYPDEFKTRAKKDGVQVIYNTSQIENITASFAVIVACSFCISGAWGKTFMISYIHSDLPIRCTTKNHKKYFD